MEVYLNEEDLTKEFSDFLFIQDHRNFHLIPKKFKTKEMCDKLVEKVFSNKDKYHRSYSNRLLREVTIFSEDICVKTLENGLIGLFHVIPEDAITQKMCDAYFNNFHLRLNKKLIPEKNITQEMLLYFVLTNRYEYNEFPKELVASILDSNIFKLIESKKNEKKVNAFCVKNINKEILTDLVIYYGCNRFYSENTQRYNSRKELSNYILSSGVFTKKEALIIKNNIKKDQWDESCTYDY